MSRILVYLIALKIIFASTSLACDCKGDANISLEWEKAVAVFAGKVVSGEEIRIYKINGKDSIYRVEMNYKLIVSKAYKGTIKADTISIYTGTGVGDCGFNFIVGKSYIVYASHENISVNAGQLLKQSAMPAFYTNSCRRTCLYNKKEIRSIKRVIRKSGN